ncbi:MAG: LCP family protein [Phascolarctobacterium sp.]|nr:LCP family protein [Phascolarctobacterium sp.]MBQ7760372.1 LCP family protein [Acidaminococcaceae bacterium]
MMKKFLNGTTMCIMAALVAVLYIVMGGGKITVDTPVTSRLDKRELLSARQNILVMGKDFRDGDGPNGRSDAFFMLMFDENTKVPYLMSIPRDTRVHIPGYGWDKINHSYSYGGYKLTMQTMEEFLGIKIHRHLLIGFKEFKEIVDDIGGLDFPVEKDMYSKDKYDGFTVDLKKGYQNLNGAEAIQFVRYRDEEGDNARIHRQQHFIVKLYEKIADNLMVMYVDGLYQKLLAMLVSDLSVSDLGHIGTALYIRVRDGGPGVKIETVPGAPAFVNGTAYWVPDMTALRSKVAEMQGVRPTDRYMESSRLFEEEYNAAMLQVEKGDTSGESKAAAQLAPGIRASEVFAEQGVDTIAKAIAQNGGNPDGSVKL